MFTTTTIIFVAKISLAILATVLIVNALKPAQRLIHGVVCFLFPFIREMEDKQ